MGVTIGELVEDFIPHTENGNKITQVEKEEKKHYSEALDMAISALSENKREFDGMTNGEVIQALFPNASFHYHKASDIVDDYVSVCIKDCDTQQDYSMAWWNSLYQKGGD